MSDTPVLLYPRLSHASRDRLWERLAGQSVSTLERFADDAGCEHRDAFYLPTGGARVAPDSLREIRRAVKADAATLGFPAAVTRRAARDFDIQAAIRIHKDMTLSAGEAGRDEVWSFISLVMFPDLARWRFPTSGAERFFGGANQRSTFQRLWWRATTLFDSRNPDDPYHLLRRLPEDALVGIMERPGISANHQLARAIARSSATVSEALPATACEDARRDAYRRIRALIPLISFDSLDADTIDLLVDRSFSESIEIFLRQGASHSR